MLPFADTSPKKDQEWLSDGFSEELLVHLANIKELRVVGRSSAFQFKNSTDDDATIAKKLGVTNLVEGSVAKIDDRVRITARLINATDGTQLWGESFDRNGKDVFAIGGHGIGAHLIVNSPSGRLADSALADADFAAQVCPVGAILPKRRGFVVPIGQRPFDPPPAVPAPPAAQD